LKKSLKNENERYEINQQVVKVKIEIIFVKLCSLMGLDFMNSSRLSDPHELTLCFFPYAFLPLPKSLSQGRGTRLYDYFFLTLPSPMGEGGGGDEVKK
jgi:hypothetical protein